MSRKDKHPDVYEKHEIDRRDREYQSQLICDKFPCITRILISLTFEDDHPPPFKPNEISFDPASRAFFELPCPDRECVMGGFSFASTIREAIQKRTSVQDGVAQCLGWEDRQRVGHHHCYLKAHYRLQVTYGAGIQALDMADQEKR